MLLHKIYHSFPQTTTVDQSRATSQVATSRSSYLLTSQGLFFLSRERLSWSLCHLCPSQPRTGAGIPPWCLLYFCLQGTTVWACLTTTRLTYLGVEEMTPLTHCPALSLCFVCLKVQLPPLSPLLRLQIEATMLHLQRVLKPLVCDECSSLQPPCYQKSRLRLLSLKESLSHIPHPTCSARLSYCQKCKSKLPGEEWNSKHWGVVRLSINVKKNVRHFPLLTLSQVKG